MTNKALTDILSEMRNRNFQPEYYQTRVNEYADRIEAAWNDEVKAIATENAVLPAVCITTKPTGNTAALREALKMFVNHASCLYHCDLHRFYPNATKCSGVLADGSECSMKSECDAVFAGRTALDKPSRNCDKYANVNDAKIAWYNYKMSCPTPPGGWGDGDLLDWFLSPAEDMKGESDGSKQHGSDA